MKWKTYFPIRLIYICIIFGCLGRVLPHPDNVTPLTNLSLFLSMHLPIGKAFIYMSFCNLLCDFLLSLFKGYSIIGYWSLFTYSAILGMVWMGSQISTMLMKNIFIYVLLASLGFWLWTNFGVWLLSGIYPKNFIGLLRCYQLALPFLRNSLLGDLLWMIILFGFGLRLFPLEKIFTSNVKEKLILEKNKFYGGIE